MLKIQRSSNGQMAFTRSGEIYKDEIAELEALLRSVEKGRIIVLGLKDLTPVGRDTSRFLGSCEADGDRLQTCAGYVREWITRERRGS
jgi:hypothetical protein